METIACLLIKHQQSLKQSCQSPQHLHCLLIMWKTAKPAHGIPHCYSGATCDKHDVMHSNNVTRFHLYHSPPVTKYIIPPPQAPSGNFWTSTMIWIYCKPEEQEFRLGPRVVVIWFSFLSHCPITLLIFNLVGCRKLRWQSTGEDFLMQITTSALLKHTSLKATHSIYFQVSAMKQPHHSFWLILHISLSALCQIFTRCSFPVSPSNHLLHFYCVDLSCLQFHRDSSF